MKRPSFQDLNGLVNEYNESLRESGCIETNSIERVKTPGTKKVGGSKLRWYSSPGKSKHMFYSKDYLVSKESTFVKRTFQRFMAGINLE